MISSVTLSLNQIKEIILYTHVPTKFFTSNIHMLIVDNKILISNALNTLQNPFLSKVKFNFSGFKTNITLDPRHLRFHFTFDNCPCPETRRAIGRKKSLVV